MSDIVFLDTEALGLDPNAPVWEFAAVRRFANGNTDRTEFFIRHEPEPWASEFHAIAPAFYEDYAARYRSSDALDDQAAAVMIHMVTRGAHMVACNPVFDDPRLAQILRRNNIEPAWHYHPDDIASLAKGYLAARGELPAPPYNSNALSLALGVDPDDYARHTAMGDVAWCMAQWDTVMAHTNHIHVSQHIHVAAQGTEATTGADSVNEA
ncbi:exonuclease domain-containing protein [Mycobacterium sp. PSTR-4-N]|uniref:exonuclease domain-containing protein n=1 Tax=Mycobacterium sp. PSTR-4-N TaxID=2917745 RepID=UPI001F1499B5|nr:exonuclease domain-containing protein [Mycobacterium sp. PSTR-4-N]MCG7592417.1 hypothetical protein [Mycobacterium sp. PSTR-4-N]